MSLFTFLFFLHWIAPVNEFLKNKRSGLFANSLAFKEVSTSPFSLRISTFEPLVKYKPASIVHLSPKGIPSPEFAPKRQFFPTEILISFPPERVPIVDAPPPISEFSATITPWEILPSTMASPSVPELKFTNPSCITVVPGPRYAPSLTRLASAILTSLKET